jgi:hypothetical protein
MLEVEIVAEILKGRIVALGKKDLIKLHLTAFALEGVYTHPQQIKKGDEGKQIVKLGSFDEQEKQIWRAFLAKSKTSK